MECGTYHIEWDVDTEQTKLNLHLTKEFKKLVRKNIGGHLRTYLLSGREPLADNTRYEYHKHPTRKCLSMILSATRRNIKIEQHRFTPSDMYISLLDALSLIGDTMKTMGHHDISLELVMVENNEQVPEVYQRYRNDKFVVESNNYFATLIGGDDAS